MNIFEVIRGDVIQKPSDLCSGLGITKTFITYPVKLVVENPIPLNIESPYIITITSEVRSFERTGFVKGHNCLQFKQDSKAEVFYSANYRSTIITPKTTSKNLSFCCFRDKK